MSSSPSIAPPATDADSAPYWVSLREHGLQIQECDACRRRRFPVTPSCPYCANAGSQWVRPTGTGTVYSYIVIHRTFDPAFEQEVPYAVATVDLDGGGRMAARMNRTPTIGDRVSATYLDHPEWTELRFTEDGA